MAQQLTGRCPRRRMDDEKLEAVAAGTVSHLFPTLLFVRLGVRLGLRGMADVHPVETPPLTFRLPLAS